jgi:Na+-transporting methylmalonyl-CoA/oxaloacetate decarboxylase gamma subunit
MTEYTIPETLVLSVLGMLVVFFVLALLMYFIKLITRSYKATTNKKQTIKPGAAEEKLSTAEEKSKIAPGSCGDVKLYNVPDKDAAMIMAIVADELKTPLNELRFISIKQTEV